MSGISDAITDVMHKRYPVGTPNQAHAQGMFELFEKHGIANEDIDQVEIHMPHYGLHAIPATRHASIAAVVVSAVLVADRKLDFYKLHSRDGVMTPAMLAMQKKSDSSRARPGKAPSITGIRS